MSRNVYGGARKLLGTNAHPNQQGQRSCTRFTAANLLPILAGRER
jgi:hypothetical protein